MSIAENLQRIKNQIPSNCKLIAVTKTHPVEVLQEAYNAGHKVFGENKVQEMVDKFEKLPKDIEWHMIGHLQSNKVKYIVPFVKLIHSIDSIKLLSEVDKQAAKIGRVIPCLLQVHIAKEETKFGFAEEEIRTFFEGSEIDSLKNIKIVGLMGMATNTKDETVIRNEFRGLRQLFDELKKIRKDNFELTELSMGMSSDFSIAAEEGSTLVRVGSAIFGYRNYNN
jgi:PLP dependent protein